MRYLFIVQGEGRGHMTQAISLSQILRKEGHEVCKVIVGKSQRRDLPDFFVKQMQADIVHLDSPNFVTDKNQKSVRILPTIINGILHGPKYLRSILKIRKIVKQEKPDVVLNFYDFLGGLFNLFFKSGYQYFCVAHQFLIAHPEFDFPAGRSLDKAFLRMGNSLVSIGADRILALSFQPFSYVPDRKLLVVPPLLRKEVREMKMTQQDHLLVYMVNPGYAIEVNRFHQQYPDISLHCFWDKKDEPAELRIDNRLAYHQLDDKKFISFMASARGYVTTAGFESVCEAMYLGKPVLMIPVEGHYEQACNAIDAKKAGAGIYHDSFEIDRLIKYIPEYKDVSVWFRDWADQAPDMFIKYLGNGHHQ